MLVIRDAQMQALQRQLDDRLERDVARYLRENHADAIAERSEPELRALVAAGVARAGTHGLAEGGDVGWFVVMMLRVSPRFDEATFFARVLSDPAVPPDQRVPHLLAWSTPEDWEEAASQ